MRGRVWLLAACWLLLETGCTHYTVYHTSRPEQVYIVRRNALQSDVVYSCDARNNAPVCYRTEEVGRE